MTDDTKHEGTEGAPKANDQANGARPATTDDVRKRIVASVQEEIARLDEYAASYSKHPKEQEVFCHAMESIAAIKARVEVYVIQVEMAASTAAMSSIIGQAMRARVAQNAVASEPAILSDEVADLLRRGRRPGGNSPPTTR